MIYCKSKFSIIVRKCREVERFSKTSSYNWKSRLGYNWSDFVVSVHNFRRNNLVFGIKNAFSMKSVGQKNLKRPQMLSWNNCSIARNNGEMYVLPNTFTFIINQFGKIKKKKTNSKAPDNLRNVMESIDFPFERENLSERINRVYKNCTDKKTCCLNKIFEINYYFWKIKWVFFVLSTNQMQKGNKRWIFQISVELKSHGTTIYVTVLVGRRNLVIRTYERLNHSLIFYFEWGVFMSE